MIKIPSNTKQFKQPNTSDILGNIWGSHGLDLTDNLGRVRAAPRGVIVSKSDDEGLEDMEVPVAFRLYQSGNETRIWAIAGDSMWYNNGDTDDEFVQDDTDDTPEMASNLDMELFNGGLYVMTNDNEIWKYDGAWSQVDPGGASPNGGDCQMCVYAARLYFTQSSSQICSIGLDDTIAEPTGTPNTVSFTLNLANYGAGGSDTNYIVSIRSSSNRIWILVADHTSQDFSAGRGGKVFEWNGESASTTKVYNLDSVAGMALIIKDDLPYVMDADGRLLQFTGSSFKEVARLPIPASKYLYNPLGSVHQRWLHPRGMIVRNGRIQMLIKGTLNNSDDSGVGDGDTLENLPSGVWEYDEDIGLYHKYALSYFQNDIDEFITDYGQIRLYRVGALFNAKSSNDNTHNGDTLMGAGYFIDGETSSESELYGIFINDVLDEIPKVAVLTTPHLESDNIYDTWQRVYATYKKFLDTTDKIILKYRTKEFPAVESVITWVSPTSFTTTDDLSSFEVGDEIQITQGTGGSQIEEILTIAEAAGTYTVTVANPFVGATDTSIARFQKWIKISQITEEPAEEFFSGNVGVKSVWIQIRCIMYFTGADELYTLQLVNQTFKPTS